VCDSLFNLPQGNTNSQFYLDYSVMFPARSTVMWGSNVSRADDYIREVQLLVVLKVWLSQMSPVLWVLWLWSKLVSSLLRCSYLGQRCISQYNPLLRHGMWKDCNRVFENVVNFKHLRKTSRLNYGRSAFTKKLTLDQVRRIRTAFPSEYFTISFCKI
jgi:hypothetical protein